MPYLAKELFGMDIDYKDSQICLRFESKANAQINTLTLTGAKPNALKRYFGQKVAAAVQLSYRYSSKLTHGKTLTNCVSLAISHNRKTSYILSLVPNPKTLSKIIAQL